MFSVCVVLVVHGHEYVHCFGNPAHPRIHLYKKDALTHYDALPPAPALPLDGVMASGDDAAPASAPVDVASTATSSAASAAVSPDRIVVAETSDDDTPIHLPHAPSPRFSARVRGTARMQTHQSSLKRKPKSSSSSSSSTSEDLVPYIHTPPHQHTPYTTLCHTHSHLPESCRSRPNQPQPLRCHTSIHHLISIHHTPPYATPTATFRLGGQCQTSRSH